MGRPGNIYEYDAYPMPDIPNDREPLAKEDEDRLVSEMKDRIRELCDKDKTEKSRKIS